MVKTREDSRIEIWSDKYINTINIRQNIDKTAVVIQAEHGHGENYIVEVIDIGADEV